MIVWPSFEVPVERRSGLLLCDIVGGCHDCLAFSFVQFLRVGLLRAHSCNRHLRGDAFVSASKLWSRPVLRCGRLLDRPRLHCRWPCFRLLREGRRGSKSPLTLALLVVGMSHGPGQTAPISSNLQAILRTTRVRPAVRLLRECQQRGFSSKCVRNSKVNGRERNVESRIRYGYRRRNWSRGSAASGWRLQNKSRCRVGRIPESGGRDTAKVLLGGACRVADSEGRLLL